MQRDRLKRLLDLHAWLGVIAGLFLFIVSFSGVVTLFGDELLTWEDPAYRLEIPDQLAPINPLLSSLIEEKIGDGEMTSLTVDFPVERAPYYTAFLRGRTNDDERISHDQRWNSATGEAIEERGKGVSYWLVDFHEQLVLPRVLGRSLVGLAGIFMLLAIITGVLTHKKIIKDLFSWRMKKTIRVRWKDSHNALGIWLLPFHTMIAFTGAFLGIVALLVPLIGVTAFKGDQDAVIRAVFGDQQTHASGIAAPMISLNEAHQEVLEKTGRYSHKITINFWGDSSAEFEFRLQPEKALVNVSDIHMNGVTGELGEEVLTDLPGVAGRITAALTPLHYATYGGIWLKILYMVLGIGLCFMIVSGLVLWLERRRYSQTGTRSDTFYDYLGRLITGVVGGLVLTSFTLLYVDRLIVVAPSEQRSLMGIAFFGIWILAIFYSLTQKNVYRANKHLLGLSAMALIGLPVLDLMTTPSTSQSFLNGHYVYVQGVNIVAFVSGSLMLYFLSKFPNSRLENNGKV